MGLVVLALLLEFVVFLVLLSMVLLLALWLQLQLEVGLGFADWLKVKEDFVPEVWGDSFRAGRVRSLLRSCWDYLRGGQEPPGACSAAAALALGLALWMKAFVRGEEEVEDNEEEKDEEEVVVLGDARCAAMRAGVVLRVAAASAAATAGRIEALSTGCGLGAGGCKGRVAIWRLWRPTWTAAVCGGGVGLQLAPTGYGRAGLLQFARVCAPIPGGGGDSLHGLHSGAAGDGPRPTGRRLVCVCGSLGAPGVSSGVGLFVLGHANCTLFCAPNAQKRTGSQEGKKIFFWMFDEPDLGRSEKNCFLILRNLVFLNVFFFLLWPSECVRPRALKIF